MDLRQLNVWHVGSDEDVRTATHLWHAGPRWHAPKFCRACRELVVHARTLGHRRPIVVLEGQQQWLARHRRLPEPLTFAGAGTCSAIPGPTTCPQPRCWACMVCRLSGQQRTSAAKLASTCSARDHEPPCACRIKLATGVPLRQGGTSRRGRDGAAPPSSERDTYPELAVVCQCMSVVVCQASLHRWMGMHAIAAS